MEQKVRGAPVCREGQSMPTFFHWFRNYPM
jgi:hypothetical protein